jgi:hypothetical protein
MYGSDPFGLGGFNPAPLSGQPLFQPPQVNAISPYHLMAMQAAMQGGQPQQPGLLGQAQQGMSLLGGAKQLGLLGGGAPAAARTIPGLSAAPLGLPAGATDLGAAMPWLTGGGAGAAGSLDAATQALIMLGLG